MMNASLNLLPWREEKFRRKSKIMLVKILILLGIGLICFFLLWFLQQDQQEKLQQQRQILLQQKQQLKETQQKITALRQQVQDSENHPIIAHRDIEQFFALLNQLPLQQGELKTLDFKGNQLRLQGWVANQGEFEQLDQFLKQFSWINAVKLEQLSPQDHSELHFEYLLQFNLEKGKTL